MGFNGIRLLLAVDDMLEAVVQAKCCKPVLLQFPIAAGLCCSVLLVALPYRHPVLPSARLFCRS